jgi:hypothetical protein
MAAGYTGIVRRLVVTLTVGLAAACVGPARDFATYEGKAKNSAEAVLSAVETARLSVRTSSRGGAFAPYVSIILTEAEEDAGSVQATFDSIQPPDAQSDSLQEELDRLFVRAVSSLTDLRVAARRTQLDALPRLARPLDGIAEDLERFVMAHS